MEEKLDMEDVSPSHQHQRGLWKSFHGRAKLTGSPKLGKKDRKQESGFWIFKKKRPNGLDRAISSSQPNLPSAALDGGDSGRTRCGMPEQSVGTPAAAAASLGAEIQMLKRTVSSKPTLSQLVQSQHKPVPQGSTCIDDAVMDGNEEQVNTSEVRRFIMFQMFFLLLLHCTAVSDGCRFGVSLDPIQLDS